MSIKFGVVGASGKMGQELADSILRSGHVPFLGLYRSEEPKKYLNSTLSWEDPKCKDCDVWIDFSLAQDFGTRTSKLVKFNRPIVSGVTGIKAQDHELLKQLGQSVPILWSSNMSIGIAFLNKVLKLFSDIKDFDFQIEEAHHRLKIDSPSGTAKTLKLNLDQAIGKESPSILSIRGGGIYGEHKIWAMSDQEVITFEHKALNRAVFADGAVKAAIALLQKKPGLYSISDIL